ncbi:MAG: hypothetical protein NTZ50_14090 [Chloroflexi bacterium]|nr:hypothetical protein [Chloroflexota bacterium]
MTPLHKRLLSKENALALFLFFVLVVLTVLTADASPQWIYQGF